MERKPRQPWEPQIRIERKAWIRGFRDGAAGRPARVVGPVDGYSYHSGWIEGDAKRQGCQYSLGTLRPEDVE